MAKMFVQLGIPLKKIAVCPALCTLLTLAKLIPERLYTGIFIVITRQKIFLIIYLLVKYSPNTNAITRHIFIPLLRQNGP